MENLDFSDVSSVFGKIKENPYKNFIETREIKKKSLFDNFALIS